MASSILHGAAGAPGIALGRVAHVGGAHGEALRYGDAGAALRAFADAQRGAAERLLGLAAQQRAEGLSETAGIFDFQALLVDDPALSEGVERRVAQGLALDEALRQTIDELRATFLALDTPTLRERSADLAAVGAEIERALRGSRSLAVPPGAVVVAPELSPADTVELQHSAAAIVTARGGPTGHSAILARARGIPMVVGAGAHILAVGEGADVIVDGDTGTVLVCPDAHERASYLQAVAARTSAAERQALRRDQPGRLADGVAVALEANLSSVDDAHMARQYGAQGVGLVRTEMLFYGEGGDRREPPSEDEHFAFYRAILAALPSRPVTVRTIDIGGDKPVSYLELSAASDPFLGLRGIRLCMRRPDLLQTQLRALLRAAYHGDVRIMLPMVVTPGDMLWAREQLRLAAAALAADGVEHRSDVALGAMIETPAAAMAADTLAAHADFFSVGTNDLAQYSLAADRSIPELAQRYSASEIGVLRLVARAVDLAGDCGVPIAVWGDLASDAAGAAVLVGMGVRTLSMAPPAIPMIKEHLAGLRLAEAQSAAQRALGLA